MVNVETFQEKMLLERGYENFSTREKNELIAILANRNELPYSTITDEYVLDHHKNLRVEMMKQKCEEVILEGFTATNGNFYRTNRDDQINMIGQKDFLSEVPTDVVYWKTENLGYISHTVEEWLDIYKQAFAHKLEKLMKYDTIKTKIMQSEFHSDIIRITWDMDLTPPVEEPVVEDPGTVVEPTNPGEEEVVDPEAPTEPTEPTEPPVEA